MSGFPESYRKEGKRGFSDGPMLAPKLVAHQLFRLND